MRLRQQRRGPGRCVDRSGHNRRGTDGSAHTLSCGAREYRADVVSRLFVHIGCRCAGASSGGRSTARSSFTRRRGSGWSRSPGAWPRPENGLTAGRLTSRSGRGHRRHRRSNRVSGFGGASRRGRGCVRPPEGRTIPSAASGRRSSRAIPSAQTLTNAPRICRLTGSSCCENCADMCTFCRRQSTRWRGRAGARAEPRIAYPRCQRPARRARGSARQRR